MDPVFIVVMGVSGTGKSTLGAALAEALEFPYVDGDDLHPRSNVDKMAAGQPLTDADREPWLRTIRNTAERIAAERQIEMGRREQGEADGAASGFKGAPGVVIACSALKKEYRDVLRGGGAIRTYFVFIEGTREVLMDRMTKRSGHFMKATMLDSQLKTLEDPRDEPGVVVVSVEDATAVQVEKAIEGL
ncbi:P-loop containing nucleoside triphosphate hydrolase protein, partial [Roridomyces roridus]